jgi:hypothetical protein
MIQKDIPRAESGKALCVLCRDEDKGERFASDIYLLTSPDGTQKAGSVCWSHADSLDLRKRLVFGIGEGNLDERKLDKILRAFDD